MIFIGYPVWRYNLPMPIYTFLESYNFRGKKIIPFSTNRGSGELNTVDTIKKICKGATVEKSYSVYASEIKSSNASIKKWLKQLDITK